MFFVILEIHKSVFGFAPFRIQEQGNNCTGQYIDFSVLLHDTAHTKFALILLNACYLDCHPSPCDQRHVWDCRAKFLRTFRPNLCQRSSSYHWCSVCHLRVPTSCINGKFSLYVTISWIFPLRTAEFMCQCYFWWSCFCISLCNWLILFSLIS